MNRKDAVLNLLSLASGGIDALSYFAFHVFTSAMTGNTVLFGLALGEGDVTEAVGALLAFAGYVAGVASATPLGVSKADEKNKRPLRHALLVETVAIAAFAALWAARVEKPVPALLAHGLTLLAGIGMGVQSATARKLHEPGVNTVVFTSTLTAIVSALTDIVFGRAPRRVQPQTWRQLAAFLVYLAGAGIGGALALHDATLAAVPPFACVFLALLFV